ncbi:MAG TPA: hypothetical protein VK009_27820 [Chloroflexota bacterium]|nr:hypothetical protein [Chloroflexota bacterium]
MQFLAELEACGDLGHAADKAGCSLEQVRAWRRTDPKFERDYVLALASHLRLLKRRVQDIAENHHSAEVQDAARELLATEHQHAGPDGRLNARAWRDSLAAFIGSLSVDTAGLEPTPPPHQFESEPDT